MGNIKIKEIIVKMGFYKWEMIIGILFFRGNILFSYLLKVVLRI